MFFLKGNFKSLQHSNGLSHCVADYVELWSYGHDLYTLARTFAFTAGLLDIRSGLDCASFY